MSNRSPKRRKPGQPLGTKPPLSLIKSEPAPEPLKPIGEMPPEVKRMLREMSRRLQEQNDPDPPEAA